MAKRRLTQQQKNRIQAIQQKRRDRLDNQAETCLGKDETENPPLEGRVIIRHGATLGIESADGQLFQCLTRQHIGHPVCGDRVIWHRTGDEGGVVTALQSRSSVLSRPDYSGRDKPLAANLTQLVVVVAPKPEPSGYLLDQYLVTALLRPGNSPDKKGAIGVLSRVLPRLREAFPRARFRVRLDAGFAAPDVLDFLDEQGDVEYAVAIGKNSILERRARRYMGRARRLSRESGKTEHVYAETRYATKTWSWKRRIIIKAEVTRHPGRDPKDNPRFVITNMTQTPRWVYEKFYCRRGDIENRIKELHHGLEIGRTSCSRFLANQLRVFLTAAAYVLMQELRLKAARTKLARAQVSTLRERLLKIGARAHSSVRRIVMQLPMGYPDAHAWATVARALGAVPG